MNSYKPGDKVTTSGFPGVVVRMYSEGMVEVRLASGLVCVAVCDVVPENRGGFASTSICDPCFYCAGDHSDGDCKEKP